MSTYLSLAVLDVLPIGPARREDMVEIYQRRIREFDPETTKRFSDVVSAAPNGTRPFLWTCRTQAEVDAMRAFLDALKGSAIPFWLPTYQQDLTLATDLSSGSSSATIRWIGYTRQMFPGSGARRHLAFYRPGVAMAFHKVTGATDPNDGVTESLGISPNAGSTFSAATTIVSFLRLCRLEGDGYDIEWIDRDKAEAALVVRELPNEAEL